MELVALGHAGSERSSRASATKERSATVTLVQKARGGITSTATA